jgi:hypothetical protein
MYLWRLQQRGPSLFQIHSSNVNLVIPAERWREPNWGLFYNYWSYGTWWSWRRLRWAGHVACMWEGRGKYRVLVGKPEGKIRLGRPKRRWEVNVRMHLQEVGCSVRTGLGWLRIGSGGGRLWVRWGTFGFRKTRGISWLVAKQLASHEGLCSME